MHINHCNTLHKRIKTYKRNHTIISRDTENESAKVEYFFMTKILMKLERACLKIRKAIYDKAIANSIVGGGITFPLKSGNRNASSLHFYSVWTRGLVGTWRQEKDIKGKKNWGKKSNMPVCWWDIMLNNLQMSPEDRQINSVKLQDIKINIRPSSFFIH